MAMETVHDIDIPYFAKNSPYLQSLLSNEPFPESGIEVPRGCAKQSLSINSAADLTELLQTLRFWIVPEVLTTCCEFFRFVFDPQNENILEECAEEYEHTIPFVFQVHTIAYILPTAEKKLQMVISCGYDALLKFLYEDCKLEAARGFEMAAAGGHLNCVQYFHARGEPLTVQVSNAAARAGQLQNLTYLHENGGVLNNGTWFAAAVGGHLHCLQYLYAKACPSFNDIYNIAFVSILRRASHAGHLHVVEYLWETFHTLQCRRCERAIASAAAAMGHVQILEFARSHHFAYFVDSSNDLMQRSAFHGRLLCLEYMYSAGLAASGDAVHAAAMKGHMHCIEFLLERNCPVHANNLVGATLARDFGFESAKRAFELGVPWNAHVMAAVAGTGNLEGVMWLRERGCPWDDNTCANAACGGHLACLQYAHENGCPWWNIVGSRGLIATCAAAASTVDCLKFVVERGAALELRTFNTAATQGHVPVIKYLLSVHCPCDTTTCAAAARGNDVGALPGDPLACVRLLHESGCAWDELTCYGAARRGDLDCLRYAHTNGCAWDATVCYTAAKHNRLECLRYAHENGCPWHPDTSILAHILTNSSEKTIEAALVLLKYVHENGCPWDARTCRIAAFTGNLLCLQYAHEHGCPWDESTCRDARSRACYEYAVARRCPGAELSRFRDPTWDESLHYLYIN